MLVLMAFVYINPHCLLSVTSTLQTLRSTQSPGDAAVFSPVQMSLCILFVSIAFPPAFVNFMSLSDLVAEAEQSVWCSREQSEGLPQISANTQGRFIINISEKKPSVARLQVCLLSPTRSQNDGDTVCSIKHQES